MMHPPVHADRHRRGVVKVLYLLTVTATTFVVPSIPATQSTRWFVVPSLFLLQVAILARCGISIRALARSASRLKWLFAILIACYAFLPGEDRRAGDDWRQVAMPFAVRSVRVNLGGLSLAALMCVQVMTVILASAVVRLTGSETDFVEGLRGLGMPRLFVHSLDQTLGQLGGLHPRGVGLGDGTGGRRGAAGVTAQPVPRSPGFFPIIRRMIRGDVGSFTQAVRENMERAREGVRIDDQGPRDEHLARDVAVITGVALVMVSVKMLKALPGVPFASGHKTLLFYPLYILAAQRTHSRWGGTAAGSVMGVIGFLQGDGRFGVLDVLKHLAPGVVIDLLVPIVRRLPQSAFVYCALGFVAAIARTATELVVVLLLGARAEVYVFPAARLVPNLIAGTLSGFITLLLLRTFPLDGETDQADPAMTPTARSELPKPLHEASTRPERIAARHDTDDAPCGVPGEDA